MPSRIDRLDSIAPRRIRRRAALWVAELHGPDRNAALEARVRRWIAADPRHAAAFELATEAWQRSGDLPAELAGKPGQATATEIEGGARTQRRLITVAAMAALCGLLAAGVHWLRDPMLETGPREQRTVELADGTEVSLNANTRLRIDYDSSIRKVALVRGEALFNVVKHEKRLFVVQVADRKVIATGTSFVVRVGDARSDECDVTLVEGHVVIESVSEVRRPPAASATQVRELNPGQRLRFAPGARRAPPVTPKADELDNPSLDRVIAWRRGQLIFDDTSLGEAADEFNRYDPDTLEVEGTARDIRVGGVFRIGDAQSFVEAVSRAHGLSVRRRGSTLVIAEAARPEPH